MIIRTHNGVGKAFDWLETKISGNANYKDATCYVEAEKLYLYSRYFSDFAIVCVTEKTYNVTIMNGVDSTMKQIVTENSKVTPTISAAKERL